MFISLKCCVWSLTTKCTILAFYANLQRKTFYALNMTLNIVILLRPGDDNLLMKGEEERLIITN